MDQLLRESNGSDDGRAKQFSYTFPVTEASYNNSRIVFDMGLIDGNEQEGTTITLSDVSLINMGKSQ